MNYFYSSSWCQCIETNAKIIMTHFLRSCNENKSIAHPSTCELTLAETVALNIYPIELKYCSLLLVIYCLNQRQHNDFPQRLYGDSVHGVSRIPREIYTGVEEYPTSYLYCVGLEGRIHPKFHSLSYAHGIDPCGTL